MFLIYAPQVHILSPKGFWSALKIRYKHFTLTLQPVSGWQPVNKLMTRQHRHCRCQMKEYLIQLLSTLQLSAFNVRISKYFPSMKQADVIII